ncbi:MAG: hypothetical protein ACKO0V_13415 [bacterium]
MSEKDRRNDEEAGKPGFESDSRFPTGAWDGFFLMKQTGMKRHMMELILRFVNGQMNGMGRDYVGRFLVRGEYSVKTGKCSWKKSYIKKHDVIYEGYNEGRGIFGKWEINEVLFVSTGGFLIWPKAMGDPTNHRRRAEADLPASPKTTVVTEDEFATVSAESAGFDESLDLPAGD